MSDPSVSVSSVFHAGEIAVQTRVGVAEDVAPFGQRIIRDHMPDQHRAFFEKLPMLITAAVDGQGRPWASAMFGEPGFMQSADSKTLALSGDILMAGELGLQMQAGAKLGLLGIELETRRRNRMNATVTAHEGGALTLRVDQSFGNCPQYIQRRELELRSDAQIGTVMRHEGVSSSAKALITGADTFFIASRTPEMTGDRRSGPDASHRGGRAGFVKVSDENTLCFPDFSGNRFFNTLGNISLDPRVGLFFPDFETGHAVWLTGEAQIIWDEERVSAFKGAERLVEVSVSESLYVENGLPISGNFIDAWPLLQNTGTWAE